MSLSDAIARFRGLDEANIPAPKVNRPNAGGGQQISPKSKFSPSYYKGADETYAHDPASPPADPEAKAAAVRSTAGVSGPGYDASGREHIDVRVEQEKARGVGIDDFGGGSGSPEGDEDLEFAEAMLNDTLGRKGPPQQEANISAPKSGRKGPDAKQIDPKSKFSRQYYKGPGQTNSGDAAPMPADPEAKAAAERSTAGVSGPGYGADGREEVDVRVEDFDPEGQDYPDELIGR